MLIQGDVYSIDLKEIREHTSALGRIGKNINQVVAKINSTNFASAEDTKKLVSLMNEIYQSEKSLIDFLLNIT